MMKMMRKMTATGVIVFHLLTVVHISSLKAQEEQRTEPEKLRILHEPVTEVTVQQPVSLTAELIGPAAGKLVYIMYRIPGKKSFRSKMMNSLGDNTFSGEIPAKSVISEGLEYYLRALNPMGNELARYPEDESYLSVTVSSVEPAHEVALPEEEVAEEEPEVVLEEEEEYPIRPVTEEIPSPETSAGPQALRVVHEVITETDAQQPIGLTAELTGPMAGKQLYLMYRAVGEKNFHSKLMMALDDSIFRGEIPAKAVTSAGLEYYLRVLDTVGKQLARYPEDESYVSVSVSPLEPAEEVTLPEEKAAEEKPSIILEEAKKGGVKWQWIGLGSLVVVGIAALALSGGGEDDGKEGPTLNKLPDPPDRP